MKKKLTKILLKWSMVLAGISWTDAEAAEHGEEQLMKALGFDRFFIPSFWPFQERYNGE
jgi:hypothetical protein